MVNDTPPFPPVRTVLTAIVVMIVGTTCASMSVYQMREGSTALAGSAMGLTLGVLLVATQYWGLFHRQPTYYLIAIIAIIPTFSFVGMLMPKVLEDFIEISESIRWIILPTISSGVSLALAIFCVWELAQTQVPKADVQGTPKTGFRSISLKELLGAMAVIGCILAPTSIAIQNDQFLYLENVPASAAPVSLPQEGTDLTFHRDSKGLILAVFHVKQEERDQWLDEKKKEPGNLGFLPRPMRPDFRTRAPERYHNGKVETRWLEFDDAIFLYWEDDYWRHSIVYSPSEEIAIYQKFPASFR